MATDTTIWLGSDNAATDIRQVLPLVFGELVKLAWLVITHYHSDLYHDAIWLDHNATGTEFAFYWSVDDCGTRIGTELVMPREYSYRFTVTLTDGRFTLTTEPA